MTVVEVDDVDDVDEGTSGTVELVEAVEVDSVDPSPGSIEAGGASTRPSALSGTVTVGGIGGRSAAVSVVEVAVAAASMVGRSVTCVCTRPTAWYARTTAIAVAVTQAAISRDFMASSWHC